MVKRGLAFGALVVTAPVFAAPESIRMIDPAKGEVLLEVQAIGSANQKVVRFTTYCDLRASGSIREQAAKALDLARDKLSAGFIEKRRGWAELDFSSAAIGGADDDFSSAAAAVEAAEAATNEDLTSSEQASDADAEMLQPKIAYQQRVGVSVTSTADFQQAREIMSDNGCSEDYLTARRPKTEIADMAGAKRAAMADALATAKARAEGHAAALNMRVLRILRVSEVGAIKEFLGAEADLMMREMNPSRNRDSAVTDELSVSESVSVDFVLVPR